MVHLDLIPLSTSAGGTRSFDVVRFDWNSATDQLTLVLRDGRMCVELVGAWRLEVSDLAGRPAHSIAEAERIHDGRQLVLMAH
jgi:hypothetical protein